MTLEPRYTKQEEETSITLDLAFDNVKLKNSEKN